MTHFQARRPARKKAVCNHSGRVLTLERLESRCCMDAASNTLPSDATENVSNEFDSILSSTRSSKIVEFRLHLLDQQRNNVESVHVGDRMFLQVYVRDLRESIESNFRFFSAFTEVSLEGNQFEVLSPGEIGGDFWKDLNQMEQEIGGLVVSPYPNGDGHLVFELPIRAIADGEATIQTSPLEGQSATLNPITLYGIDQPLDTIQVSYQSLPVTVLPKLNAAPSETNETTSSIIVPVQTTLVISPTFDSPSPVLQPQVVQPTKADDSTSSSVAEQLPTSIATTDAQQAPELGSSNFLGIPSSSLENLLNADQELSFVFDSQDTANLDEQLYTHSNDLEPIDFQVDSLRLQYLVSAHPFFDLGDSSTATSLTSDSSLISVPLPSDHMTSHHRVTTPTASYLPSQKVIRSMLHRLGAYCVEDSAVFLWEVSYMRIPISQLQLHSDYVRYHQAISGSRLEEFVIPQVIVTESVPSKLSHAVPQASPLTIEADSSSASEAWSAYQRASMKLMSLSKETAVNSKFADHALEINPLIKEGETERESALNQHEQSTMSWWIAGVLSLVASGAWLRDRGRIPRSLGNILKKRIPGFQNAGGDTES